MNVFVDYHHADLKKSLSLLFEDRLGFKLYHPTGIEWHDEGWWKLADNYTNTKEVVSQWLDCERIPWKVDPETPVEENYISEGVHYEWDHNHRYHHKAITLDRFKQMRFDYIIASYQPHEEPFKRLRDLYHPKAKLIAHVGNIGQESVLPNVMHSVRFQASKDQNSIYINQELNPKAYGYLLPDLGTRNIYNVTNGNPSSNIYNQFRSAMAGTRFKSYGINCPDGLLNGAPAVGRKMIEANLGWTLKKMGSLGHSNMGWLYSGRATVTNMNQHREYGCKATLQLFEPDVTCIDLDSGTASENIRKICRWLTPGENQKRSEIVRKRFEEVINYDQQEEDFRTFLGNLRD